MTLNRSGKSVLLLAAAAIWLLPRPAAAASMTLGDAIENALANNPSLRLSSVSRQSAETGVLQAEAGLLPTVSGDVGVSGTTAASGEDRSYQTANAGVSARYNLYDGGSDRAVLQAARKDSSAAGMDYQSERETLLLEVTNAYLDVLSSSEIVAVREEELAAANSQLERIEALYLAGSRPVTDLYQQQASVKAAELSLISSQRDLTVSRLNLQVILGLDRDPGLTISDPVLQGSTGVEVSTDLDEQVRTALGNRRDVGALEARLEAAQARISQARAGNSVSLDLTGGVSTGYSSLGEDGFWDQISDRNMAASVGLTLSIPLYEAGQTGYAVRQAELDLASRQLDLNRLKLQVRQELGQALEDYRTAVKTLDVSTTRLQWAE
ncbi:MAG: TolC family protein, partial [Pseudomonadota bacterium]